MKILQLAVVGLIFTVAGCDSKTPSTPVDDRDNTAVNARDVDGATMTPMDQSNDSDDIDQVAAIRSAVLDLEDLSTNGRNVKIITDGGQVVLRGPVASDSERDAIVQVAERIAGSGNVNNQLEVETD
ncbi:BON domain-containing protein [Rubripirellula amarantea]|nr:BON domain-containing protein [Rubripirellula amarantea]